jgi:hypothetical protein
MNQRIMQVLPPSERQLYDHVLRTANAKPKQIPFDTDPPLPLVRGADRVTTVELPKITVVSDAVKSNEKRDVLKRQRIDPQAQQMELMIETVRPLPLLQE